ncbi:MAG TPA: xanthine dehydrogenase family protein molybdopterin-binding subunit [Pseudomonas xinjiangensis]|uniref:Xanthine dehydrogenase family protein molybdopterin-binding subunit n=2 Tax=root TaxID=1 RepID=A0A7V1FQ51_9GAMM|nr:xanthine dehydrogenase family protein molybdopterin-binding subunit [Halopseudomonas xinjiangensis]HEC46046.1 xanthine dehydrogenase family protein molybdopterin-binding subunit [Halopseudomonas xinjiangensis]
MSKPNEAKIIGASLPRIDGPEKLSGAAKYAADNHLPRMSYAYGVFSTIASGRIQDIDVSQARQMSGVLDIFHHGHFPTLYRTPSSMEQENKVDETRLPFEDDKVYYPGQFVALVVAETFEQARAAAYRVKVDYASEKPIADLEQALATGEQPKPHGESGHERGDPASAFNQASNQIDVIYTTPMETHNPMEMHASTAMWDDGSLVLYESTQGVIFARNTMAKIFGLPVERVVVHAPFIGSGFGSKLWIWPHAVAAAAASRQIGRPVQLVVPRQQMFTTTGHRPATQQHIQIGTDAEGRLVALSHETVNATSMVNTVAELAGRCTPTLYSCSNVKVSHATVRANIGTPTAMRAPGAAPGLFALESAIDEAAVAIGMDPLAFRKLNYTEHDEGQDLPFSSIHLMEAYEKGAEKFGWSRRNPEVGSMRDGNELIGWGMAACNWEALKQDSEAHVSLRSNGTVYVSCATQDIGTGTYTVVAQTASAVTGVPVDRIQVKLGDSTYPRGPLAGGSWATATVMPAIAKAAKAAIEELKTYATGDDGPFQEASMDDLQFSDGQLSDGNGKSITFGELLKEMKLANADGRATTSGEMNSDYSYNSFGAHFVEVRWDPGISRLRVSRVVSAIDVGQIVNQKTAANQVEGAIVMGIGMALYEQTEYDPRSGLPVNNNYAEYLVPTHADQPPEVDVLLLDHPDYNFSEFGARGIGEIGITGLAGAVANAVYHATGKRIRSLPITLDKLMA